MVNSESRRKSYFPRSRCKTNDCCGIKCDRTPIELKPQLLHLTRETRSQLCDLSPGRFRPHAVRPKLRQSKDMDKDKDKVASFLSLNRTNLGFRSSIQAVNGDVMQSTLTESNIDSWPRAESAGRIHSHLST